MRIYLFNWKPFCVISYLCLGFGLASAEAEDTFFALTASGDQKATDVVVDDAGDTYAAGSFSGTVDFAPQAGVTVNRTAQGSGRDLYVAAYTAAGALRWVFHGEGEGSGVHNSTGLCLTTDGNVVVCGSFTGQIRFGTETEDPVVTSSGSSLDGFVFKLNTAGAAPSLAWHTIIRFTNTLIPQAVHSVKVSFGSENFVVVGSFNGDAVFNLVGGGTTSLFSNAGSFDLFVTRLNPFGSSTAQIRLGGSGTDQAMDVTFQAVDDWIHVGGSFTGTVDFDPGAGVHNETSAGTGSDGLIATFDENDLSLVAVSALHCPSNAVVNAVEWTYNIQGSPSVWVLKFNNSALAVLNSNDAFFHPSRILACIINTLTNLTVR